MAPDNYSLTQVTVTQQIGLTFAVLMGVTGSNVSATATAAHRPRDVAIVLDYSGSMNNESDLWNNETYLGTANDSPNSNDTIVPAFGHYSDTSGARLINTSGDPRVGKSNVTQAALGIPPIGQRLLSAGPG